MLDLNGLFPLEAIEVIQFLSYAVPQNYFIWVFMLKSGTVTAWDLKCVKHSFVNATMKTQG